MNLLDRIKRIVRDGRMRLTTKARAEMERDGLDEDDLAVSILSAETVRSKRSVSRNRRERREMIRIIEGETLDGIRVYTEGVIRKQGGKEVFFVLVSAKRSVRDGAS